MGKEFTSVWARDIVARFVQLSKFQITVICLALIGLSGLVDLLTGIDAMMLILYLVPIFISGWVFGFWKGSIFSLLSGVIVTTADLIGRETFLPPLIHIWNAVDFVTTFLFVTYIASALHHYVRAQRDLARVDHLTGIPNRRSFFETLHTEILRARRDLTPLTIAYIDIDRFKSINDQMGHTMGDLLLKQVAQTMKMNLRATDSVARLGGDEFAILLPHSNSHISKKVLDKVFYGLNGMAQGNGWPVTFSLGAVTFLKPPKEIDELLSRPDELMYFVKKNGEKNFRYEVVDAFSVRDLSAQTTL